MDGYGISEDQMRRLSGVARTTRQSWADAGLLTKNVPPFSLPALLEAVTLAELRLLVTPHAEIAYMQLRPDLAAAATRPAPIEAIVDLVTSDAAWFTDAQQLVSAARLGNPVQLIDMTRKLINAQRAFDLAVQRATEAAAATSDELGKRRSRSRTPRRTRQGSSPQ